MKVHHSEAKLAHGPLVMKDKPRKKMPVPLNRKKPKVKGPSQDGLSLLWEWYSAHNRELAGAPDDLIRNALGHMEGRINILRNEEPSNRIRVQLRWLRSWQTRALQYLHKQEEREAA